MENPLKKRGLGGCKITSEKIQPPESPFIKGELKSRCRRQLSLIKIFFVMLGVTWYAYMAKVYFKGVVCFFYSPDMRKSSHSGMVWTNKYVHVRHELVCRA